MGMAQKILLAYSIDWIEFFHSTWEKAKAIRVVKGKAVKNPAIPIFFPEIQETKLIRHAATNVFNINRPI